MTQTVTSSPAAWDMFYRQYYTAEIGAFAAQFPDTKSIYLDFEILERFNADLADELLTDPESTLGDADKALLDFALPCSVELSGARVRILNAPEHSCIPIQDIRSTHIGAMIRVDGLVRTRTKVNPILAVAAYECSNCGEIPYVDQLESRLVEPYVCPSGCGKARFRLLLEESTLEDVQWIRIQEMPESLRGGEQPQTIDAALYGELTGAVTPGEHIQLTGTVKARQQVTRHGRSTLYDTFVAVNHVDVLEKNFADATISPEDRERIAKLAADPEIYSKIVGSIAPAIKGYDYIKEALALQLMGGVPKDISGSRLRGDIHIILIGDPGVAKSQLLQYVAKIAPRSIYTSGRSASASCLTAACVQDELTSEWAIEARALVLADNGIACVDEMDKMRSTDRNAIHEAMSVQTVSIAKVGMMATLKSRCAVLGAANPKYGRFDPYEGFAQQIQMGTALLSRFDLIFIVEDHPDRERDAAIAGHILDAGRKSAQTDMAPEISPAMLQMYAAAARQIIPRMEDDAVADELQNYYVELRQRGNDRDAPTSATPRQMGGLIRLAEASARMRLSDQITLDDAHRAIKVTEDCIQRVALDPGTGLLDVDRIELGTTRSQRDKIRMLRGIIDDIAEGHGGAAPISLVAAAAVEAGIDTEQIDRLISDLLKSSEIMSDASGLRLARS